MTKRGGGAAVKACDPFKDNFGLHPTIRSQPLPERPAYAEVGSLTKALVGQTVTVRARAHKISGKGKVAFITLRHKYDTVQASFAEDLGHDAAMVKFAQKITAESIIEVQGEVVAAPSAITSCTQHEVELKPIKVYTISAALPQLPFQIVDASRSDAELAELDEKDEIWFGKPLADCYIDHWGVRAFNEKRKPDFKGK
jgi:aspartyl-tRNA synthetase